MLAIYQKHYRVELLALTQLSRRRVSILNEDQCLAKMCTSPCHITAVSPLGQVYISPHWRISTDAIRWSCILIHPLYIYVEEVRKAPIQAILEFTCNGFLWWSGQGWPWERWVNALLDLKFYPLAYVFISASNIEYTVIYYNKDIGIKEQECANMMTEPSTGVIATSD